MSDRNEIRRRIKRSRAQESAGMARIGGVRHRGSGNGARKGDGRTSGGRWYDNELVEFKQTGKKQMTLRSEDLEKISAEAALTGRIPALVFEVNGRSYVVHEEADWRELRSRSDTES